MQRVSRPGRRVIARALRAARGILDRHLSDALKAPLESGSGRVLSDGAAERVIASATGTSRKRSAPGGAHTAQRGCATLTDPDSGVLAMPVFWCDPPVTELVELGEPHAFEGACPSKPGTASAEAIDRS